MQRRQGQNNLAGNGGTRFLGHNRLTESKQWNGFVTVRVDPAELISKERPHERHHRLGTRRADHRDHSAVRDECFLTSRVGFTHPTQGR